MEVHRNKGVGPCFLGDRVPSPQPGSSKPSSPGPNTSSKLGFQGLFTQQEKGEPPEMLMPPTAPGAQLSGSCTFYT